MRKLQITRIKTWTSPTTATRATIRRVPEAVRRLCKQASSWRMQCRIRWMRTRMWRQLGEILALHWIVCQAATDLRVSEQLASMPLRNSLPHITKYRIGQLRRSRGLFHTRQSTKSSPQRRGRRHEGRRTKWASGATVRRMPNSLT